MYLPNQVTSSFHLSEVKICKPVLGAQLEWFRVISIWETSYHIFQFDWSTPTGLNTDLHFFSLLLFLLIFFLGLFLFLSLSDEPSWRCTVGYFLLYNWEE